MSRDQRPAKTSLVDNSKARRIGDEPAIEAMTAVPAVAAVRTPVVLLSVLFVGAAAIGGALIALRSLFPW